MKYLLGLIRNVVVKITHDEDFAIRCKDFIFSFMKRKTVYFEGKNISFWKKRIPISGLEPVMLFGYVANFI